MLHHVDPSQVQIFKGAIESKFNSETIAFLPEAPEPTAESITPEPTAPAAPDTSLETEIAIDVEVLETPETPATDAPTPTAPTPTPGATTDIEGLLNKMSIQNIRKLASAKGTDTKGTRASIAARLKKIVTVADIWAIG